MSLSDIYWTSLVLSSTLCGALHYYGHHLKVINQISTKTGNDTTGQHVYFRRNYLAVYYLASFCDWLQGPYLYQLYIWYGLSQYQIVLLFGCAFGSSLLSGLIIGNIADKLGRRFLCVLYCFFYGISCFSIYWPYFTVLIAGRVLCGIGSSILLNVFESWLIHEHNRRGFDSALLNETLSYASFGNGLVAVLAGLIANYTANSFGYSSPFGLSILPLCIVMLVIRCTWEENYGTNNNNNNSNSPCQVLQADSTIIALQLSHSCCEAAMYVIVIFWTLALYTDEELATEIASNTIPDSTAHYLGLIFAVFMMCVALGASLVKIIGNSKRTLYRLPMTVHCIAALSAFTISLLLDNKFAVFAALLIFQVTIGMFYAVYGAIKNDKLVDDCRYGVSAVFRIPLIGFTVLVLLYGSQHWHLQTLFMISGGLQCVAFISYLYFYVLRSAAVVEGVSSGSEERFSLMPKLENKGGSDSKRVTIENVYYTKI